MTETFGPHPETIKSVYNFAPAALEELALWLETRGLRQSANQFIGLSSVVYAQQAIGARVYHSANQSITDSVATALAFNSERFDTNVIHDTSTNNSRLTCKTAGKYAITADVQFAANATGVRQVYLQLNAAVNIALAEVPVNSVASSTTICVDTLYDLAVNDYVTCVVFQNSGGALNVLAGGNYTPEFSMVRVGA